MTRNDDLDRMLSAWLDDPLTLPAPGYLGEVLEETRQMRQRKSWASLERWLPVTLTLRRSFVPMPAVLALLGLITLLAIMASLSLLPLLAGALAPTGGAPANGLIAFSRDGDIFVIEPTPGAAPRLVVGGTTRDREPLWSPDGQHLAFLRVTPGGESLMLTDASGSEPLPLLAGPVKGMTWFEWAPDSRSLLVTVDPAVTPDGPTISETGLAIVPIDGSGAIRPIAGAVPAPVGFGSWRPVGSGRLAEMLYRRAGDPSELRFADLSEDGEYISGGLLLGAGQLAGVRTPSYGGEFDFLEPVWSPLGDRFAYFTLNDVIDGFEDLNGMRVHVARFDRGETSSPAGHDDAIVEFDPMSDDEGWPIWSPDGTRLAFQVYENYESRVVIMGVPADGPADPSSAVVTEAMPHSVGAPGSVSYAWAPDGTSLVMVNHDAFDDAAYLVDTATGEVEPLGWGTEDWPSWQPRVG